MDVHRVNEPSAGACVPAHGNGLRRKNKTLETFMRPRVRGNGRQARLGIVDSDWASPRKREWTVSDHDILACNFGISAIAGLDGVADDSDNSQLASPRSRE